MCCTFKLNRPSSSDALQKLSQKREETTLLAINAGTLGLLSGIANTSANLTSRSISLIICNANGGDRLRQGFGRPTDAMPGYSMQLVKTRREKTIANNNELALAA